MSIYLDIVKRYKGFTLDVKIDSSTGTLGILGGSGSGKSLTLKCLSGLVKPDEGVIRVGDRVLFDSAAKINLPAQKRNVGYLFQSYALFPNMTVRDNIAIAINKRKPASEKEAIISRLIDRYSLQGLEKRFPINLSGGQQQRVALARIFAYEPEVLLLDEPFSALDTFLRESMQVEMQKIINEYDGDVLLVTHSRDEAYKLCEDLVVFYDGKISAHGKSEDLFADPINVPTARITGCKNIFPLEEGDPEIENGFSHIGIRARRFSAYEIPGAITINVKILRIVNGPFEKNVIMENIDKPGSEPIWWICDNDEDLSNLNRIYIKKEDISLLKSFP